MAEDLTGTKFGRMTLLRRTYRVLRSGRKLVAYDCRCDCGVQKTVPAQALRDGRIKSCGCYASEALAKRNIERTGWGYGIAKGKSQTAEYSVWYSMRSRCDPKNALTFPVYAGKGISVCERWLRGEDGLNGFECFLADMGKRPSRKHEIDRIDSDGNYEPANCRWLPSYQNKLNQRRIHTATINGVTKTVVEHAKDRGFDPQQAYRRYKAGYRGEDIFDYRQAARRNLARANRKMKA